MWRTFAPQRSATDSPGTVNGANEICIVQTLEVEHLTLTQPNTLFKLRLITVASFVSLPPSLLVFNMVGDLTFIS